MKDDEKLLPKPLKALGSTSLHLTSSASDGDIYGFVQWTITQILQTVDGIQWEENPALKENLTRDTAHFP